MRYTLFIVDEYTRFTWVHFLFKKDETPEIHSGTCEAAAKWFKSQSKNSEK